MLKRLLKSILFIIVIIFLSFFSYNKFFKQQKKISEVELLETELKDQLKEARLSAQKVILEAEQDSENLYKKPLALATAEANSSREKARLEIDSQRAEKSQNRAKERLKDSKSDRNRADISLIKALNRLKVANRS